MGQQTRPVGAVVSDVVVVAATTRLPLALDQGSPTGRAHLPIGVKAAGEKRSLSDGMMRQACDRPTAEARIGAEVPQLLRRLPVSCNSTMNKLMKFRYRLNAS